MHKGFVLSDNLLEFSVFIIPLNLSILQGVQIIIANQPINRLKVVLLEQGKISKWLALMLDKNKTTVSRWCINEVQSSLNSLSQIVALLEIDIKELLNSSR